jgi:protein-tyrosine-phosphatase
VLEQAGVVRRGQSEGDRRRSYVQLAFNDPDVARLVTPWPLDRTGVNRVLFVCTHNSARSQLAVAAWRQISDLPVASAGTSPANRVHPRATATARRHGLRLRPTRPTHIDQIWDRKDLLVAVCDNAHESLRGRSSRQLHWAVPDPVRVDSDEAFESAYREIRGRVDRLAASLAPAGSRNGKQPRHPKDLS